MTTLRELAAAATPGPWWPGADMGRGVDGNVYGPDGDAVAECFDGLVVDATADAAYIAACYPDVTLALLAAIPDDPWQDSSDGWNTWCYSCGHGFVHTRTSDDEKWTHAPDCAWVKAREVMG